MDVLFIMLVLRGEILLQVSADGYYMLLLLSTRDTYMAVINLRSNKMMHELQVTGCYAILLSPNSDYVCTSSVHDTVRVVRRFMFILCY